MDQLAEAERLLERKFRIEPFPHGLNVSAPGSDLRVQIQTDPRYLSFVGRATVKNVLGLSLPVASPEDVLQGKLWAVVDSERQPSKRQKDQADIARLLEAYPELRKRVPSEVLARLV
ncbi:MAG: nucleotidyl transferase AbiEii/AbiGii toxin family protein [Nitrospirota bacterium]